MRRQKRKKKCLIFACMRLLQTDMRRQMPAGAGRGVPAGAAPGPPRQLQHPQLWGGHTHTASIPG